MCSFKSLFYIQHDLVTSVTYVSIQACVNAMYLMDLLLSGCRYLQVRDMCILLGTRLMEEIQQRTVISLLSNQGNFLLQVLSQMKESLLNIVSTSRKSGVVSEKSKAGVLCAKSR